MKTIYLLIPALALLLSCKSSREESEVKKTGQKKGDAGNYAWLMLDDHKQNQKMEELLPKVKGKDSRGIQLKDEFALRCDGHYLKCFMSLRLPLKKDSSKNRDKGKTLIGNAQLKDGFYSIAFSIEKTFGSNNRTAFWLNFPKKVEPWRESSGRVIVSYKLEPRVKKFFSRLNQFFDKKNKKLIKTKTAWKPRESLQIVTDVLSHEFIKVDAGRDKNGLKDGYKEGSLNCKRATEKFYSSGEEPKDILKIKIDCLFEIKDYDWSKNQEYIRRYRDPYDIDPSRSPRR